MPNIQSSSQQPGEDGLSLPIFSFGALGLMAAGVLHLIVMGIDALSYLPLWLSGILWTFDHWLPVVQQDRMLVLSGSAFWSSIASPAVPLTILGLHWYRADQRDVPVSRVGPIALLGWTLLMSALMPPSGFVLLAIIACMTVFAPPRGGWA